MTRRIGGPGLALALGLILLASGRPAAGQDFKEHENPRSLVKGFIRAAALADADPDSMAEAAACLDLSGVPPEERAKRARTTVLQLKRLLNSVKIVPPDEIPDAVKGPPVVLHDAPEGAIVVERVDGRWLFSADSVAEVPDLYAALEAQRREREEAAERAAAAAAEAAAAAARAEAEEEAAAGPGYESIADWIQAHMPPVMRGRALMLEWWQWAGLGVLLLVGTILNWVVLWATLFLLLRFLKRRGVEVERLVMARSLRPFGFLFMSAFWWVAVAWLGLPEGVEYVVVTAVRTVAALAGVCGAYRVVDVISSALEKRAVTTESKFDDLLVPLVRKSAKVFVVAFGFVFVADTLEFSISSLLAGLGLGGLAFALAAQDTVKNFFGSLTVVLDRPFEVGDWVVVEGGTEGMVEEVGFRSTRIRTFHNSVISIPNAKLLTATVDNMGARRYRRWYSTLLVSYDTPPDALEALCEGIRELVRRHPDTRKDYYQIWANGLGGSGIEVLLYVFFECPDWGRELEDRHRLILDILRLARRLEVKVAYPTHTVFTGQEAERFQGSGEPAEQKAAEERGRREALALIGGPTPDGGAV